MILEPASTSHSTVHCIEANKHPFCSRQSILVGLIYSSLPSLPFFTVQQNMPHFPRTPEALLGRNDSKNPSTTCKGITSSGRPCRRPLASPKSSPTSKRRLSNPELDGVAVVISSNGTIEEADFYCWQHKDQAQQRVEEEQQKPKRRNKRRSAELFPLQEKSSIDTLVQRLGLDALPDNVVKPNHKPVRQSVLVPPRKTEAQVFAGSQVTHAPSANEHSNRPPRRRPEPKKKSFWSSFCCAGEADDDYVEIVHHKKRTEQNRPLETATAPTSRPSERQYNGSAPPPTTTSKLPLRPATQHRESSQTTQLLSFLPPHLSPQTTSSLLAELIKPISPHDEEGYIYIFWLTPQNRRTPPEETARSLLTTPSRAQNERRISDVMSDFSFDGAESIRGESGKRNTIMLKIGRANNVTRRMNEWQRQCGYALSLVRWYPYVPSSTAPSPVPSPKRQSQDQQVQASQYPALSPSSAFKKQSDVVRKVPCVKRVERLIHLELADMQAKKQCTACGKEHREWFEIEASQAGVKAVDECVRRWVGWAESQEAAG